MHPVLFGPVKSYGLLLAVSFLVGIGLSVRRGRPRGLTPDLVIDISFGVLVSSLIGVRLAYVLTHLGEFDPWYRAFYVWDGGLVLHGGVLLAILTVWWLCRRRGVPFLLLADVLAPGVALGIGITRIGCFLAGCCFGAPTGGACAVHFPLASPAGRVFGSAGLHPAQLYSSAAGFLVFGLLLLWERRPARTGATFGRFLFLYGATRFGLEFWRYIDPESRAWLGLSDDQWISLALVVAGGLLLARLRSRAGAPV